MSARWAALLLGSAGLHAAAFAVLTFVAVKAGLPPALVVDLSAWEQAIAQPLPATAPRRAPGDRPGGRTHPPAPPVDAAAIVSSGPAGPPRAAAPLPGPSPAEMRPSSALAGSHAAERQPEPHAAPAEVPSGAQRERQAEPRGALPVTPQVGASAGGSGSPAAGSPAGLPGLRAESGGGTGPAGGDGAGLTSPGRDGGAGLGGSGGSRLALALPGEGRGGVPAEYGPYLARFRQRVQDALVYPLAARRRGLSGTVELEVLIDPGGRVQRVEVSASSSHALLDEAAVEAVREMAPLPLPETLPARPLRVRLPLVFELR